ncbi:MAG: FG-GAP-like repeat-containing protein [bacterium]
MLSREVGPVRWQAWRSGGPAALALPGVAVLSLGLLPDGARATFIDVGAALPGVSRSSVAWGDFDDDDDLDLLLTGKGDDGASVTSLLRNDAGTLTSVPTSLPAAGLSAVCWGDYDDDGDLDVLIAGMGSYAFTKVFRNDHGLFHDIAAPLPRVDFPAAAWGDYDNDGDLDLLLTGSSPGGLIARLYRNGGAAHPGFTDAGVPLEGVTSGSVAFGDFDDDGDLDILITGQAAGGPVAKVYRNDGAAAPTFTDLGASLTGVTSSSSACADYDDDGDLDILLAGWTGSEAVAKLYRNDGGASPTFTDAGVPLTGVFFSSVAWGDYDNDGNADILLTGWSGSAAIAKVYRNGGGVDPVFEDAGAALTGVLFSSAAWADYDGDGDLDILLTGFTGSASIAKLYRNDGPPPDSPPSPPSHLSAEQHDVTATPRVTFRWDLSGDVETPPAALSYNLRIGTTPGGSEAFSAMANAATGWRKLPSRGNTDHRTSWTVTLPAPGTYYWSVQAVDGAFQGSPFAGESVLHVPGFTEVSVWLGGVSDGAVAWGDYDDDGDLDALITGSATAKIFRNDPGAFPAFVDMRAALTGVSNSSAAWGDYDNDGDLDILLTGVSTKVYRNNGEREPTFTDIGAPLPAVSGGTVAWGDYDNDGDLDILLTGHTATGLISRVYRHDVGASSTFTDVGASLVAVREGSAAWGDYDNDGNLDILLAGEATSGPIAKVYRNSGGADPTFTDSGAALTGVYFASAAWGDYDDDGDLDILLAGSAGDSSFTKVYRNDAGAVRTFTDIGAPLEGLYGAAAAWGDFDDDGNLDILLGGSSDSVATVAKVYRNSGGADPTFTDARAAIAPVAQAAGAWGDFDGDGDLDVLWTGLDSRSRAIAKLYRNDGAPPNAPPSAPANLVAQQGDSSRMPSVTFGWSPATDDWTPAPGLSYNLRIGSKPGSGDVLSAMAGEKGTRKVAALGNAGEAVSWTVRLPSAGTYYWSVQTLDGAFAGSLFADAPALAVGVEPRVDLPAAFALAAAAPNPFSRSTAIRFELPRAASVSLRIYDVAGRLVRVLEAGRERQAGRYQAEWDGRTTLARRAAPGVYFCEMKAGDSRGVSRVVLVR